MGGSQRLLTLSFFGRGFRFDFRRVRRDHFLPHKHWVLFVHFFAEWLKNVTTKVEGQLILVLPVKLHCVLDELGVIGASYAQAGEDPTRGNRKFPSNLWRLALGVGVVED
jgi:hypothetical protein